MVESSEVVVTALNVLLQLVTVSAVLTDRYQTEQWVTGEWIEGNGAILAEANPTIRETATLDHLIGFNLVAAYSIPRMLSPPWSTLYLGAMAAFQANNAAANNENAGMVGLDRRWAVGYTLAF